MNSFVLSGTAGAVIYAILCKIWPLQVYPAEHNGESKRWETTRPSEGFFHGDETMPAYIRNRVLLGEEPTSVTTIEQEQDVRKKE